MSTSIIGLTVFDLFIHERKADHLFDASEQVVGGYDFIVEVTTVKRGLQ